MTSLATALGQVPYFAGLDAEALAQLAAATREQRAAAGELLLSEGEPSQGLWVVLRGRVKVFKLSPDGREHVLRILGEGRTFNDVPVFDGGANPANAAALEDSAVACIPAAQVQKLVRERPAVAGAVIQVLAGRLRAATEIIEDLALRGVTARVARLLLQCSRGNPPLIEGAHGPCARITQAEIAAMTGSVREVTHRALKMLESEGAIELSRSHIRVLEPDILAEWSGEGSGD